MSKRDDTIFRAIVDPTRRRIIQVLVTASAALTIGTIAEKFPSSRQAIRKHIAILHQAGLVSLQRRGRELSCSATLGPLKVVRKWVSQYLKSRKLAP